MRGLVHQSSGTVEPTWTRPADWPDIASGQPAGTIRILVGDMGRPLVRFQCQVTTGGFDVAWGDGTTNSYGSNATVEHSYTAGTGTACSRGYTTFTITVTPTGGGAIQMWYLAAPTDIKDSETQGLLMFRALTPSLTLGARFSSSGPTGCPYLESVDLSGATGLNQASSINSMFYGCISLENLKLPNMPNVVQMNATFRECKKLRTISGINPVNSTLDLNSAFYGCTSLTDIGFTIPGTVTDLSSAFYGCASLRSIDLSKLDGSLVALPSAFRGCTLLETITMPAALPSPTSLLETFYECTALKSVTLPTMAAVTNLSYTFYGCTSLTTLDLTPITGTVTTMSYICQNCTSLVSVTFPPTRTSITTLACAFSGCTALRSLSATNLLVVNNIALMCSGCDNLTSFSMPNLGQNATSVIATGAFTGVWRLSVLDLSYAKLTRLWAEGTSLIRTAFTSVLWHPSSTWSDNTSPTIDLSYGALSNATIQAILDNLPRQTSSRIFNLQGYTTISSPSFATTNGSTTATMASTTGMSAGQELWLVPMITFSKSVTFTDSGDLVTQNGHGFSNGKLVHFTTITSTTGIVTYTPYYVINATTNTYQLSATPGGAVLPLTTNGSGTVRWLPCIASVTSGTAIVLDAPAPTTSSGSYAKLPPFSIQKAYAWNYGFNV